MTFHFPDDLDTKHHGDIFPAVLSQREGPRVVGRVNSRAALCPLKGAGGQAATHTGQVGFVLKLKTIAGPCECLCGAAYGADLHVKNMGAPHTHRPPHRHSMQGFDPLKEMDTLTCTHTYTHASSAYKRRGRVGRGLKDRRHTAKKRRNIFILLLSSCYC